VLRRTTFSGSAPTGNRERAPRHRLGGTGTPAHLGEPGRVGPAALRQSRDSSPPSGRREQRHTASAPATLRHGRRSRKPSGRTEKRRNAAPGQPTPLGGAEVHGGAPAEETTELRPRPTQSGTRRPRLGGAARRSFTRREAITPAMHALDLPRKDEARRQNGPDGACPEQPAASPGAKASPTPSGDEPAEAAGAPPLLGEAAPPAARPPGPTEPFLGRAAEALPRPDRPTPLGGAASRTTGPTDHPPRGARRRPRGVWRHRRPTRHHRQLLGAATGATEGTTQLLGAAQPTNGTLAHASAYTADPLGGPPDRHRHRQSPDGRPPRGPTRQASAPPRASPIPGQRPPRGPLNRHRHRQRSYGRPLRGPTRQAPAPPPSARRPPRGPTEQTAAPRRAPRSPTQPEARDQRTAPQKGPKAQGSIERRLSGNAEQSATDSLVAQSLEVGQPARPGRKRAATRAASTEQRQGTARGHRPW